MEGKFEGLNRMLLADDDCSAGLLTVLIIASSTDHPQVARRRHLEGSYTAKLTLMISSYREWHSLQAHSTAHSRKST